MYCAISVEDCKVDEGRRLDGSCNNPKYPIRGASYTIFTRVLPPYFEKDGAIRKAKSGKPLPASRRIRTTLLCEGLSNHPRFTVLLTSFWVFMTADAGFPHEDRDLQDPIMSRTRDCCRGIGNQSMCAPAFIPDDDPVHRFSSYRCINHTKPFTYVNKGCVRSDPNYGRVNKGTPLMDLSNLYGSILKDALRSRLYEGGLLKFEEENDTTWPPSYKRREDIEFNCQLNEMPEETRCHDIAESANGLMPLNMVFVWFWRQHNYIARKLAQINPCWDDDVLFYATRDILIAMTLQIYYYEMLPSVFSRDYMIKHKIISPHEGFRDMYNASLFPQTSQEYRYVLRWVHLLQQGIFKMYDEEGKYVKEIPVANLTARTGYLVKNFGYLTQGAIRQPCANSGQRADPVMAEFAFGALLPVLDVFTNDEMKGKYEGHQPYVKFVERCTGKTIKSFEDLKEFIDYHNIKLLQEVYANVEDISLIAGCWMERLMEGAEAPPTVACLAGDQLKRNIETDRFWYESDRGPRAFKLEQLMEIRKATMARILCDSGDTIAKIQPQAFLLPGPGNEMISCDDIEDLNYEAWKDEECQLCHEVVI